MSKIKINKNELEELNLPQTNKKNIELHAHIDPFLTGNKSEKYSFINVIINMALNEIDVLAIQGLDKNVFSSACKGVETYHSDYMIDKAGIKFKDLNQYRFILNSREYTTKEGFHLLTVGYSVNTNPNSEIRSIIDTGLKNDALVIVAHPFVDNGKTFTAGHISKEKEGELEDLCKEYNGQIALEWNGYCHPDLRWGLKQVLNILGQKIQYHDVNKKAEDFSFELMRNKKLNIPVISGTDVHASDKSDLLYIGTSSMKINAEGKTPSELLCSIKRKIFAREYYKGANYAGAFHVATAFGIPIVKDAILQMKEK